MGMSSDKALDKLGPKSRMFVLEFMKDMMHTKAAVRCGLSASAGASFMQDLDVLNAIGEQVENRKVRTLIDADWVLMQLADMFNADMADIFNPGTNTVRPVHEWPAVWRKMATSIKVVEKWDREGGKEGEVVDVKLLDRMRALENIGRHTDVRAYTDRVEVATDQQLMDQLIKGRKRARDRNTHSDTPSFI